MSKMKKVLLMCTAYVLVAALAIGGTIAYLQDSDSDVNVMTLGNVKIEQHEYEREVDADGNYVTDIIDSVTSYVLKDFTQGKPLLPIVGDPNEPGNSPAYAGYDSTIVRMTQVDSYGFMELFAGKNAQDKFVTVENTGKTDAYVRTLVAIENGTGDASLIGIGSRCVPAAGAANSTAPWVSNYIGQIKVDDNTYGLYEYVYRGASDVNRHENGILPAGDTTYPSLCQVYLKHNATNEDMVKIDGNGNGTLDILVVSQAVQAAGFADAETALNAGFGDITTTNHPWANGVSIPVVVATADELSEALAAGKDVVLTDDVVVTETISIPANANMTLNLNGNDITGTFANPVSLITNNGDLTIEGEGEISVTFSGTVNNGVAMNAISNRGNLTINGGKISNTSTGNQIGYAIDNYNGSSLTINGGEITASGSTYYDAIRLFCGSSETVVTVNGGEISSVWAQNPSANKATEVKGTVIVNGGNITTVYYENYTTVKVADGVTTTVTPYGAGSDNTTSASVGGYTVYSFVH